ncbi:hypothetical protein IG631_13735 [Alternaria alternata]|nr:hypothetical protein IG631_13735 [Alternaria alternata]
MLILVNSKGIALSLSPQRPVVFLPKSAGSSASPDCGLSGNRVHCVYIAALVIRRVAGGRPFWMRYQRARGEMKNGSHGSSIEIFLPIPAPAHRRFVAPACPLPIFQGRSDDTWQTFASSHRAKKCNSSSLPGVAQRTRRNQLPFSIRTIVLGTYQQRERCCHRHDSLGITVGITLFFVLDLRRVVADQSMMAAACTFPLR